MPLSELLAGWSAQPIRPGIAMSGATVERWTKAGEPDRFLKTAAPTWDRGLDAEAARLRWLATTALADRVARIVATEVVDGVERLLTTAVAGVDGVALAEDAVGDAVAAASLARAYGAALRELHDTLDPAACPFDGTLDVRLAHAERRIAEGGVDPADFEPAYAGRSPADLLAELHARRPADEDLVVGHGDWCWPNVLFDESGRWGMVDLAGVAVACRWNDLGIGSRSTAHNLGVAAVDAFLDGYGIAADDDRLAYFMLLDELQ